MQVGRRNGRLGLLSAAIILCSASLAPSASAQGGVLVVGDSLEVGTSPYLRGLLHGIPITVDAQTSRPSSTGVAVLRSRLQTGDRVVVFDLGTNDDPAQPQALASDLEAVRGIVADRCVVVATLNRPPYNGVSIDGLDQVVRGFAAGSPPAQLVDWRGAALSQPGLLGPDGVHATAAGYSIRAELIARGVLDCFAMGAGQFPGSGQPEGELPQPIRTLSPPPVDWAKLGLPNPAVLFATVERGASRIAAALGTIVSALDVLHSV